MKVLFTIRKKILMIKLNHYIKKERILFINKNKYRQYGITTRLIQESFKTHFPIVVTSKKQKKVLVDLMYKYSVWYGRGISKTTISKYYVFLFNDNSRGLSISKPVILDTDSTLKTVVQLGTCGIKIYTGVLYK